MHLTIGVLICHIVAPELEPVAGDYCDMFEHLFRDHAPEGCELDLRFYDVTAGKYPQRLKECDGYVTSGASASVNDDEPWIAEFEAFIRRLHDEHVKLFAICFGHQMVAKALGGRVEVAEQGWGVGVQEVSVTRPEPWMIPSAESFRIISSHQDQITELPPGAKVLASSPHCPVSMIRCGSLVGIQGHPEFRARYGKALLELRTATIPAETWAAASESFDKLEPDYALLTSWICHYLQFP